MRSVTISNLLINLLLLASVAWSLPDVFDGLSKRADTTSTATGTAVSVTSTAATDSTSTTASAASTGSGTTTTGTTTTGTTTTGTTTTGTGTAASSTNTASGTTTGITSGSKTTSFTSSTSSISVNPEDPAGGISMTYPASTSTTYYKIGQNVTMGWNYTSVQVTPTAVNVIASCSSNKATYTLAYNSSYANATQVIWNTEDYGSNSENPLLTAEYTLIIYEYGTSPTGVGSAGELSAASHTFGMYLPQSYTPLNQYVCVTCSAAVTNMERQALGLMLTVAAITVTSFTLFAGGCVSFLL